MANLAAGSVGRGAGAGLRAIFEEFGVEANVVEVQPGEVVSALETAVAAKPDLLVVLAGDGTARLAAELCGPDGPLLAPLPGGTMNMLPRALYGTVDWRRALRLALAEGRPRMVSGGEIQGQAFYVAAILGAPALFADAREAVRSLNLKGAVDSAKRALHRAFAGRLRFNLGDETTRKAGALSLICPLVSRALTSDDALEADALDPRGVTEAFRLGLRAAFSGVLGDWRQDPSVSTGKTVAGRAWARGRIPAILDGEPHRFSRWVKFSFRPDAFRALAPELEPPPETPAEILADSVVPAAAGAAPAQRRSDS